MPDPIACSPKSIPRELLVTAAARAVAINPVNHPPVDRLAGLIPDSGVRRESLTLLTTKYWNNGRGVQLTVGFMDEAPADLRARIVGHMNAWAKTANVTFTETSTDPQVRIAREGGGDGGYWSYLGTDVLQIPEGEATMNLEAFTMQTPDSEFVRVVRHETGHTLGFPHEHMRKELVEKIDVDKAIAYFERTQGWNAAETRAQVLTPLEESSLLGSIPPDPNSIMCYQVPGTITKDGQPIVGGKDIDESDYAFAAKLYPKPAS